MGKAREVNSLYNQGTKTYWYNGHLILSTEDGHFYTARVIKSSCYTTLDSVVDEIDRIKNRKDIEEKVKHNKELILRYKDKIASLERETNKLLFCDNMEE